MLQDAKKVEIKLEDFLSTVLTAVGKITDIDLANLLKESHKTISVAESLTGGEISLKLTNVPGASDYFIGGIVAYSNRIKIQELGVPPAIIAKEGAVSEKVACLMAEGIKKKFKTDIGIAITGCAGPDPLPPAPVGLVFVALSSGMNIDCKELNLQGTRNEIKEKATQAALGFLWFHLGGEL